MNGVLYMNNRSAGKLDVGMQELLAQVKLGYKRKDKGWIYLVMVMIFENVSKLFFFLCIFKGYKRTIFFNYKSCLTIFA